MSSTLDRVATIVLALAAVIVAVLLVFQGMRSDSGAPMSPEVPAHPAVHGWSSVPAFVAGWEVALDSGIRVGDATAPVQIIEFIDFQCPACQVFHKTQTALRALYSETDVAFTFLHFPLPHHPHALSGAQAAECADLLGKFDEFHNEVFTEHQLVGVHPWSWFAESAGLTAADAFQECLDSDRSFPRISAGPRLAKRFGVKGTPTVAINGFTYGTSVPGLDELEMRVRAILGGRHPFSTGESHNVKRLPPHTREEELASDESPACPDCVIQFDLVTTFGSLDDENWFPEEPRTMARDSRGRLYLAFPNLGQVLVFDAAGNALPSIGRSGEGPGEYQLPYLVRMARSDSIVVFDFARQLSLVSPAGRFQQRAGPVLVDAMDLLVTGDGTVVFSGASLGNHPGTVFSVYDMHGDAIERAFHKFPESEGGLSAARFYLGSSRHPDRFWATPVRRYELMEYRVDGTLTRRITRKPTWLRKRSPVRDVVPPSSTIWGLAEANDQIWTVGRAVGDDWIRYWNREILEGSEREDRNLIDYAKLYRSIVEVVGIDTGRLVTSADIPGTVLAVFPDLHVASYRENEAGVPFIDVFRMSLSQRPNERDTLGR